MTLNQKIFKKERKKSGIIDHRTLSSSSTVFSPFFCPVPYSGKKPALDHPPRAWWCCWAIFQNKIVVIYGRKIRPFFAHLLVHTHRTYKFKLLNRYFNRFQQIKQNGHLKKFEKKFEIHFRVPILKIFFPTIFRPQF